MSGAGRKIVPPTPHRTQSPLFAWIRNKLLGVDRDLTRTPPAGLPGPDGKCEFQVPNRYPDTQAARSPDPPKIPGGVHHKLADNYYYTRDARRQIEPPKPFVKPGDNVVAALTEKSATSELRALAPAVGEAMLLGPRQNFGLLKSVTPGFGYEWKRKIEEEEETQRIDRDLRLFEKFDAYKK